MIIKAINVDDHNIVISADVKQETEKGNNVRAFSSTTSQICTMDKLSQWNRILRQARDAALVLTAAVMAKRSLKVIERERGTSCPRRTRRPSPLRSTHRSQ